MSRARHKMHKAHGGKVDVYAGAGSNVLKEAEERKHGGKAEHHKAEHMHGEGETAKERHDRPKRARGGAVPGRKRGGGVGANLMPLSTAAKVKHVTPGETPEEGERSD